MWVVIVSMTWNHKNNIIFKNIKVDVEELFYIDTTLYLGMDDP